jgi:hypothetical protein
MPVPYTFGTATSSIPLSQLDSNFATAITIGNTAVQLGNTVTTLNNLTLANVTISSGNVTVTNVAVTTANVSGTANVSSLVVLTNETVLGNTSVTGNVTASINVTGAKLIPTGTSVTGNGLYLPAANALGLSTNGTNAVYIDSSQNVGIGTSSPSAKAQIGDATVVSTNRLVFGKSQTASETNLPAIGQKSDTGSGNDLALAGTSTSATIRFYTGASTNSGEIGTGSNTERMRVDSSGNVGIGTSSPSYKLDVAGSIRASSGNFIVFANDSYVGFSANNLAFNNTNDRLVFSTASTERMRIDSSGNLLVGTTSYVSGFSAITTILSNTNSLSNITLKDSGTTYGVGTQYISFVNSSNAGAGSIQHTAATTVAYATSSDSRLKENITDSPPALSVAQQIKVRSYNWKEDGRHVDYGFVAQELNAFFPEAVCQGDDSEEIVDPKQTWQVDYGKITPLLLKSIQELKSIIDTQASTITQLQADVATLKGNK